MNIMLFACNSERRYIVLEKALGACRRHIPVPSSRAWVITGRRRVCVIALAYWFRVWVYYLVHAIAKNGERGYPPLIFA